MADYTAVISGTLPACRLRPLQTPGRYREPEIEAQILALAGIRGADLWRRARQKDPHAPDYVHPETLVYLLREKLRCGERDAAGKIAELLLERHARAIYQQVACWTQLSASQKEECLRDIQIRMLEDFFDLGRGCEFWEIRFWVCLKRRASNIVQKYRTMAQVEFQPSPIEDGEGHVKDALEAVAAPQTMTPETQALLREALAALTDQERIAFVLFYYEGWSQEQIAQRLGVVDRTIRNLLYRAERRLATWRAENLQ